MLYTVATSAEEAHDKARNESTPSYLNSSEGSMTYDGCTVDEEVPTLILEARERTMTPTSVQLLLLHENKDAWIGYLVVEDCVLLEQRTYAKTEWQVIEENAGID